MQTNYFIAGDWGTSNLRLYLCRVTGKDTLLVETRFGQGISEIQGDFEDRFFNLAQEWIDHYGVMPVILSGMIGSNIGWKEAPYLSCPLDAQQIAEGRISFSTRGLDFSILSGLRCTNPLQAPDVMRGEELQLLGWMQNNQQADISNRLFTLPGTHNKWALVRNATIETFLTAYTGELFALLRKNSILISDDTAINFNQEVFLDGVRAIENLGSAHLLHALFATRSKQVLGEMANVDGLSYLSGLLAGTDVQGAWNLFNNSNQELKVTVIGEPTLTEQYLICLDHFGIHADSCDPSEIAIAGFATIFQTLYS